MPVMKQTEADAKNGYMGIPDALRRIADALSESCGSIGDRASDTLLDIAGRIESEMVELPKDADGRPWHLLDEATPDNMTRVQVAYMTFYRDGWNINGWRPDKLSRPKPRTVSEISAEMAACAGASAAQIHEWAEELEEASR